MTHLRHPRFNSKFADAKTTSSGLVAAECRRFQFLRIPSRLRDFAVKIPPCPAGAANGIGASPREFFYREVA
jgi:hypothetical protein